MSPDVALRQLAWRHGIETTYTDLAGHRRDTSDAVVLELLAALGVPLARREDAPAALAATERAEWSTPAPPVAVAWEGVLRLPVRVPAALDGGWRAEIACEDGGAVRTEGRLEAAPIVESVDLDGQRFVARRLELSQPLPLGHHILALELPGVGRAMVRVISAPRRVWAPTDESRRWGAFLPLYAVRGRQGHGAGDLGDLAELTEWIQGRGGAFVGTLPLLAAFLDTPCETSPYVPVSRRFWSEVHLDLSAIPETRALRVDAAEAARLEARDRADLAAVWALKRPLLDAGARSLLADAGPRREAFEAWRRAHPSAESYARFRAVVERRGATWTEWPAALQRPEAIGPADFDAAVRDRHLFAQWCMDAQLGALAGRARERGLGLYLDLPIGVSGGGFDPFEARDLYVRDVGLGAPPDDFFHAGQDWGCPPLHPARLRASGYAHWLEILRGHLRHAGVLRIDHVMGLHRGFWVPRGRAATEGSYVRSRPEEQYALLSLESHRSRTLLIGEDLGTVPPTVRDAMAEHRLRGLDVLQFGLSADPLAPLPAPRPRSVVSLGTHDLPPFAAFATGADLADRRQRGWIDADTERRLAAERSERISDVRLAMRREGRLGPSEAAPERLAAAVLEHLAAGPAETVVVDLADLWGETRPQNVPGTMPPEPNWSARAPRPLAELREDPELTETLGRIDAARRAPVVDRRPEVGPIDGRITAIGEQDLHLFNEGTHARIWERLGAHLETHDGKAGVRFAVWAPNAEQVGVMGDFNGWDGGRHLLSPRGASGIWEGFVPGLRLGDLYKFHVVSRHGWHRGDKADPFGLMHEAPPKTASVVWSLEHDWQDAAWMAERAERQRLDRPISVYEVHLGSWARKPEEGDRSLSYRELAPRLAAHVKALGFTHVELLPVMEHPFYGSWGYQLTGFFAPSRRYGTPQDFKFFVDHLHQEGIGVILDWVPSHFPGDPHGLAFFDGTHLYEHADPRKGFHPDWKSHIFNYGRHEVVSFLVSNAVFWLDEYHIDGLRVDAVASMLYLDYSRASGEWIPNRYGGRENLEAIDFLRRLNDTVHGQFPGVLTIAEESTAWPRVSRPTSEGGLGFDMKWDMGWMHDTLSYLKNEPIFRRWHHDKLTFRMMYAWSENFTLSLSHDEVVHGKGSLLGKMPGDPWQRRANLRLLYAWMMAQPGKKLLFMGQELGPTGEWSHDRSLDWHLAASPEHEGIRRWLADLARLYRDHPALHRLDFDPAGFQWIDVSDRAASVLGLLRRAGDGNPDVAVVFNFTPVPRYGYRVGLSKQGTWRELANGDAEAYGGSGIGNAGAVQAEARPWHGQPASAALTLPPLAAVFLEGPR